MHSYLTVRENLSSNLQGTFAICCADTQEPIAGFDQIKGNEREVIEYAKRLSLLESWNDVQALKDEIKQRSLNFDYNF